MNHYFHGLMAGLVIEPQGSTGWEQAGVEAFVKERDGSGFREFAVFTQDNLSATAAARSRRSTSAPSSSPPASPRRRAATARACPTTDLSCSFARNVFLKRLDLRAATPSPRRPRSSPPARGSRCASASSTRGGTNTNQVFEIFGHNWSESPYETPYDRCEAPTTQTNLWASQQQGTTNLCANQPFSLAKLAAAQQAKGDWQASLNAWFGARMGHGPTNHLDILLAQAGGPFKKAGTYMYRSFPSMHFANGVWGWFNVVDPGQNPKCSVAARPDTSLMNQLPTSGGTQ